MSWQKFGCVVHQKLGEFMKLVLGSDHAGFELKSALSAWLLDLGHQIYDVGGFSEERVDYPEFGAELSRVVAAGEAEFGIAVCGSGQGICMAANKIQGIRAALIRTVEDAQLARAHNNANVACFGGRVTDASLAQEAFAVFLSTPFEGGRHADRVAQLNELT
jgi:ribose 5-phosphate isomerase B